ncbi:hypothetical protein M0R04_15845 [Candidatus Dojkabacteria bacterium]|nr:hypothetical protein [Candidatus Dojkabacteria bacterium]
MATQILPDEEMIADSDKLLTFTAYDENGAVLNLTGAKKLVWLLSPSGDTNKQILKKTMAGNGGISITFPLVGKFRVRLDDTDTIGLDGEYTQQILVTDSNNNTYRAGEGRFLIYPAIAEVT